MHGKAIWQVLRVYTENSAFRMSSTFDIFGDHLEKDLQVYQCLQGWRKLLWISVDDKGSWLGWMDRLTWDLANWRSWYRGSWYRGRDSISIFCIQFGRYYHHNCCVTRITLKQDHKEAAMSQLFDLALRFWIWIMHIAQFSTFMIHSSVLNQRCLTPWDKLVMYSSWTHLVAVSWEPLSEGKIWIVSLQITQKIKMH